MNQNMPPTKQSSKSVEDMIEGKKQNNKAHKKKRRNQQFGDVSE